MWIFHAFAQEEPPYEKLYPFTKASLTFSMNIKIWGSSKYDHTRAA